MVKGRGKEGQWEREMGRNDGEGTIRKGRWGRGDKEGTIKQGRWGRNDEERRMRKGRWGVYSHYTSYWRGVNELPTSEIGVLFCCGWSRKLCCVCTACTITDILNCHI